MNKDKVKSKNNFYIILDIIPGASHNEILHAYNRAKNTYSSGSLASYTLIEEETNQSIMDDIEEAYTILGNPSKRREYDMEMGFKTWVDDDAPGSRPAPTPTPSSSIVPTIHSEKIHDEEIDEEPAMSAKAFLDPKKTKTVDGVQYEPNPEFEKKILETTEIDGAFLKAVRIFRCYSPDALAQRCKLSTSHILAIENEDAANLHQPVYLRGHVYLVCKSLDLPNPDKLSKFYVDRLLSQGRITRKTY